MASVPALELARHRAKNFFRNLININALPSSSSYYFEENDGISCLADGGPCFAPLLRKHPLAIPVRTSILAFASSCYVQDDKHQDVADKYWAWLISPEKSPFRSIIKDHVFEEVHNVKGKRVGYLFPTGLIRHGTAIHVPFGMPIPWPILINFAIMARQTNQEGINRIITWDYLIEKGGFTPEEAYLLASLFAVNCKTNNFSCSLMVGGHWAFNPYPLRFSFGQFVQSDLNHSATSVHGVWCPEKQKLNSNTYEKLRTNLSKLGKVSASQFSSVREISLTDIRTAWETIIKPEYD